MMTKIQFSEVLNTEDTTKKTKLNELYTLLKKGCKKIDTKTNKDKVKLKIEELEAM